MHKRAVLIILFFLLSVSLIYIYVVRDAAGILAYIKDYPATSGENRSEAGLSAGEAGGYGGYGGKNGDEALEGSDVSDSIPDGGTGGKSAPDGAKPSPQAFVVSSGEGKAGYIYEKGETVQERILIPDGFERLKTEEGSFGEYLKELPLKAHGSKVKYYNGGIKPFNVHEAVIDMDVGNRDLQQCADSIIRLRAEYFYGKGLYDQIHFNFTNGFMADFSTWMKGNRIQVNGNKVQWVARGEASSDYSSFRRYLDMVFAYAGTLSLSKEMESITVDEMLPGDVFMYGNTPGHCVIVLDMAENNKTGEKIFILAQGYMPAQDMHILKNPANTEGNPWYNINFGQRLSTPEWEFTDDQLMRFCN